jgi:DNA-directed RNA polymerase subunit beta
MYNTINRLNFASATDIPDYPDFLDIQIKSFGDFFQLETKSDERTDEGLFNTFMENFPISDSRNQFVLEFLDYFVDPPRYSIQECIERGLTYSVPLKARLKLYCTDEEHEDFETIVQESLCHSYIDPQEFSLGNLFMLMEQNYIPLELFHLKDRG